MKGTKNTKNPSKTVDIKSRQKVLLPTLKAQQRYVVYTVLASDTSANPNARRDFGVLHNNIVAQCNTLLGVFDGGKAGLMGVKYNADTMKGIIRTDNRYVDKLKVCLGLIRELNGRRMTVDCTYVSGMLNKAVDRMDMKDSDKIKVTGVE